MQSHHTCAMGALNSNVMYKFCDFNQSNEGTEDYTD